MTDTVPTADAVDAVADATLDGPRWAADAPRGGRTELNRVLKDSTAVPLVLAQTFIQGERDKRLGNTPGNNSVTS